MDHQKFTTDGLQESLRLAIGIALLLPVNARSALQVHYRGSVAVELLQDFKGVFKGVLRGSLGDLLGINRAWIQH